MSLSFCVLASGSSGNCTLVSCNGGGVGKHFLIDAGLSPRATGRRLQALGVSVHDLRAIVLTHLDHDHFHCGWLKAIHKHNLQLRIHLHHRHRHAAWRVGMTLHCAELFKDAASIGDCISIASVLLAHDALGSVGFVVEHHGMRLGYATDLGRVPDHLFDHFVNLDALAIESNYDRTMQQASGRPWFLKRRIMGGAGHLSNEQAFEAISRIESQSNLAHVALLHLSRECNDPDLVRTMYARRAPHLLDRLIITEQHSPSAILEIKPNRPDRRRVCAEFQPFQLSLF
jgi:phosphoribosyl 1,2-cyclic phosphodiesterase